MERPPIPRLRRPIALGRPDLELAGEEVRDDP